MMIVIVKLAKLSVFLSRLQKVGMNLAVGLVQDVPLTETKTFSTVTPLTSLCSHDKFEALP